MKTLFVSVLCYSISWFTVAQVNTSQAGNYKVRTISDRYLTDLQSGYVVLKDGTRLDGEISLFGDAYDQVYRVKIKMEEETYNLSYRALSEYGLMDNLINDTPGAFSWRTLDKISVMGDPNAAPKPSNTRKANAYGYVITKEGKRYQGKLTIKEFKKKIERIDIKTDNKEKFKFEASELSNFGAGKYQERTDEVTEDSIVDNQESVELGSEETQMIAGGEKDPPTGTSPGYIILANGEKKVGTVEMTFPAKLWFARAVAFTDESGESMDFINSPNLQKIVLSTEAGDREFINYENEYVEILHREGQLIHFRNPHPTTTSTGGDLANMLAGAAAESADQAIRKESLKKQMKDGDISMSKAASKAQSIQNSSAEGDIDFTEEQLVTIYAKEFVVWNQAGGKPAIYIPGRNYNAIDGELMGSMEYLRMPKEDQKVLRKMEDPNATLKFLDEKINRSDN